MSDLAESDWQINHVISTWREKQSQQRMDITASSQDFTAFLLDCVSKNPSERDVFTYQMKIGPKDVQTSAIVLPPLTHCSLSEFTGPLQFPTVLLVSPEQLQNDEVSPELEAILDQFSDSDHQERDEVKTGTPRLALVDFFKVEVVSVGQQLLNKRRYLKQELDFHSKQSRAVVTHVDLSRVQPLSLDEARALVSLYLVGSRNISEHLPALWVPCRANSVEDIVGLACEQHESEMRLYIIREKWSGGVESGKMSDGKVKPVDLHGNVFAEYEILLSLTNPTSGPQVSAQFVWENPEVLLGPPPPLGTEAVLHVAVEPGNLQSIVSMFTEIQTLLAVCKAVSGDREYFHEGEEVLGRSQEPLVDKIGEFFESINMQLSCSSQVHVMSPSIETTAYRPRENLDFTESLWMFVKDAKSAEELQATLGHIFKSLLLRKGQNVTLRESSRSSLADLLRQLMKCTSVAERQTLAPKFQLLLTGDKALRLVAQIGIEKIKQDLKCFLVGANVANLGDFETFFEGISDGDIISQCHRICNLYHVVELAATILGLHCLPNVSLTSLTKAAMGIYKERNFAGFKVTPLFSVALPRSSAVLRPIIEMCTTSPPRLWCLLSNANAKSKVMSTRSLVPGRNSSQSDRQCFTYETSCNDVHVM